MGRRADHQVLGVADRGDRAGMRASALGVFSPRLPSGKEVRGEVRFTLRVGADPEVRWLRGRDRGVLGEVLPGKGMEEEAGERLT